MVSTTFNNVSNAIINNMVYKASSFIFITTSPWLDFLINLITF